MPGQLVWPLGRAPRFPKEPIDVRTEHREGVIQAKDRIKFLSLELALARNRSSSTKDCLVGRLWKVLANKVSVMRVGIRSDLRLL